MPLTPLQLDPNFAERIRAIRKRSARRLKQDFDYLLAFAERALKYADIPSEPNPRDAYVRIAPSICESIIP